MSTLLLMFWRDEPISKRQLGIALAAFGALGFIGSLAVDLVRVGRQGGIGPAQASALFICLIMVIVGLSLIPLGDKPA